MTDALVDFHCHLDLYSDFERLVEECDRLRIHTLAVTTTPRAWARNRDLCERTKHVRAALGLHPQLVEERWHEIDTWERHLPEARYVGEVGLDAGPRFYRSLDRQKDIFGQILQACSVEGGKILSVHSVRAAKAVLDMIEDLLPPERGTVVLHWFTGSVAEAKRAADLGCYFSVNARMLTSDRGTALVCSLPRTRLLTETDGPFTEIGARPARPADVIATGKALGTCLGLSEIGCRTLIRQNLKNVVTKLRYEADPRA